MTQLPPPARFVGSSSSRRRRAGPSGPSGSGCLQSIHPPLTSQHQSSLLLPSHSHSTQKTTHNFRTSSHKKTMLPTWSVESLASSRSASQRLQLLSVGCAGCYCCGRVGLVGLRGRAETAAARRGLLATRASEDAARGCRSATHRHLLTLPRLLTIQSLAIRPHNCLSAVDRRHAA